jgi:hypothetical protein
MFGRDMTMNPDGAWSAMKAGEGADSLSDRAAELEREAEEQMELLSITANGYMKRLHRQLAESLQMEAAMLRRQRDAIRSNADVVKRRPAPVESELRERS